jgi:tetratricopeptide (TPR) repeat protein
MRTSTLTILTLAVLLGFAAAANAQSPPASKFLRPANLKTVALYTKAAEAEAAKLPEEAIKYISDIVALDPQDFIAWEKLGTLHYQRRSLTEAGAAYRKSLEIKPEYPAAVLGLGTVLAARRQLDEAIELFKQVIAADAGLARAHRLLGEAYLQDREGTLGIASLNEALKLDPVGMAECHLILASLYDRSGLKHLASREYRLFLKKVPNDRDRKTFEEYIKENPEK